MVITEIKQQKQRRVIFIHVTILVNGHIMGK